MNMPKVIQTVLVLVTCVSSQAQDIACPAGTKANGETTPDVSEAWCELFLEGGVVQHGPTRSWYPNGVLGTTGQYDEGKPVGKWHGWYESGAREGTSERTHQIFQALERVYSCFQPSF